jgi:LPS-assembly protein
MTGALVGGCVRDVAVQAPVPQVNPIPPRVTTLEALRIDPALLGPPPPASPPPAARLSERLESAVPPSFSEPSPDARSAETSEAERTPSPGEKEIPERDPPLVLRLAMTMSPPSEGDPAPRPVFLSALRVTGEADREFVAEGEGELRKTGSVVNADLVTFLPLEDASSWNSGVAAPGAMKLALGQTGFDDKVELSSTTESRGEAKRIESMTVLPPSEGDPAPRPVFLSALRMTGKADREFVAEGEVELRKTGSTVNADLMTYWPLEDEVEAQGRVRLRQGEDVMTGPKMRLRMEDQIGHFEQPFYRIKHQSLLGRKRVEDREKSDRQVVALANASSWNSGFGDKVELSSTTESRGEAKRIDFEGENHYRLLDNTFTTCPIDNDAWYVQTSELKLDYDREVAEGRNATVYFQDVPFLYTPWFSFSLNDQRKSGFLPPSIGTNSDDGFEFQQPYYWNIAPNLDATISPRVMSKRGIQFDNEFRYLNAALGGVYEGKLKAEYLPGDRLRDGDNRYAFSLTHNQSTNKGFTGSINYTKASDDDYYTNLSSDISGSSQTQLLQQGMLSYGSDWWSASVNFQQYQTLQSDKNNPVLEQYRMLPQITFGGRRLDFHGMDVNLLGQYTRFDIQRREQFSSIFPDGRRTVLYPQVSLPYIRPGGYVTPKLGVNYRRYSLSGEALGRPDSISVALPVFSVDSGMTFERSSRWFGRDYTQTLEPRLYYLNIPYKDQSRIPLFDTALADFNFAQIFSENQFSGWDRVSNARQLTAALTSRLVEPESGGEVMRAMIGQRFHFTRSKVNLDRIAVAGEDEKWNRSDFLAAFSGQILPKVFVDTAWQFDPDDRRSQRYSLEMRYRPEPGKVLNAAYRRNRETSSPINQVDVSGQWPLFGRWHGVGRLNYSFKDDGTVLSTGGQGGRIIESITGLEYNGGCWILRGVVRRQALTSEDASTAFYVQLELSGLGRIGSNPLSLLRRNVQGYGLIGKDDSRSVFDE